MKDIAIVIQGPTTHLAQQKEAWKEFKDQYIFSTWKGSEELYSEEDTVVFTELPPSSGPSNMNYHMVSTLAGLYKAKELGYKHLLKLRADLVPTNASKFLSTLQLDKFNFLCWHDHIVYPDCPGYLVDYLMSGPADDLIKLWTIPEFFCLVPEIMLTWNYINQCSDIEVEYFLDELNPENDLIWLKAGLALSSYQRNEKYDKFRKYDFSKTKEYLTRNYLKFLNR